MKQQSPLTGRTVLVTGGAHRVGGSISLHLGSLGARVLVHYHRSAHEARKLVAELEAGGAPYSADLSQADGPRLLLEACEAAGDPPDAIVHAAASFLGRSLLETSVGEWDAVMALNLRSTFLLAQQFTEQRGRLGKEGDLIVIGDSAGLEIFEGYFAHSVAKAALIPMVKALAKALAPQIRVNGVIPGPVLPPASTSPAELARMEERTLLKRIGDPSDVAQAVEFLLTCDFATGSWVKVTGGSELWREPRRSTAGAAALPRNADMVVKKGEP
jgi:NAD(P)-dependent dehydrogenase (short-subunit alcohol dehydrogenase family)